MTLWVIMNILPYFPNVGSSPDRVRNNGHCESISEWLRGQSTWPCPVSSYLDLLRYRDSVTDVDAEVSHRALDLGVAEQP
jgi:hypothetical protein